MSIESVVEELQGVVADISGIRAAPVYPPDAMSVYPFAVCYARSGVYQIGPPEVMTGLHTVVIEVHVARKDLARDVAGVIGYADAVPAAIFAALADGTLTSTLTIATIRYEFGPLGWAGVDTLGYRFYLEGVKTQDVQS